MRKAASTFAAGLAAAAGFVDYPGFTNPGSAIESVMDRGPIVEIVVRCPAGTGIMSYSKIDRQFCTPGLRCAPGLAPAVRRLCKA